MTTHQPMPVAGYTTQSDENVALANELKQAEERYLRILERLAAMKQPDSHPMSATSGQTSPPRFDGRFIALAKTAMQEANMWAVRSIFQPTRIKLPEDPA